VLKYAVFALVMIGCTAVPAVAEPVLISAPEAHEARMAGDLTLIDVRTPAEWSKTGRAQGAIGATLQDADFIAQVLASVGGDKTKPVALMCRTGQRSSTAAARLEQAGFTQVYNVREGFVGRRGVGPGWRARNLPIERYDPSTE